MKTNIQNNKIMQECKGCLVLHSPQNCPNKMTLSNKIWRVSGSDKDSTRVIWVHDLKRAIKNDSLIIDTLRKQLLIDFLHLDNPSIKRFINARFKSLNKERKDKIFGDELSNE